MEQLNKIFDYVTGLFRKLVEVFFAVIILAVLGQILYGKAVMGMDVVGNVIVLIDKLGQSGFVGILAVVALLAIFMRKQA